MVRRKSRYASGLLGKEKGVHGGIGAEDGMTAVDRSPKKNVVAKGPSPPRWSIVIGSRIIL
jgi:hypothetical protein